jgi:hypothetical protein
MMLEDVRRSTEILRVSQFDWQEEDMRRGGYTDDQTLHEEAAGIVLRR